MHTPPATLVASADTTAVEESVAGAIAQLPSPESRRSYEYEWRRHRAWLATEQLEAVAVRPRHIQKYMLTLRGRRYVSTKYHQYL